MPRANHHQLLAYATDHYNRANGDKESNDWRWGDVLQSAAEQLKAYERLKELLRTKRATDAEIDAAL